jgi:hypothetical protein
MSRKVVEIRSSFLSWIIANLLGFATLGALIFVLPFLKSNPGIVAGALIIGLPIGLSQWIALRRLAPISILWVLTIAIGLLLSVVVLRVVPGRTWEYVDDESVVVLAAIYTAFGFIVGLIQWFLLRRQFPNSLVWLLGSSLGSGLGFGLVLASGLISQSGIISSIIVVLVYASATGLALEWLHGHDARTHSHLPNAT